MALRGKAVRRLYHSLWRLNSPSSSGSSGHGDLLGGSTPCRLQHWASSLPQRLLQYSSHPASSSFLPCRHIQNRDCHVEPGRNMLKGMYVEAEDETIDNGKEAGHVVDICSHLAGLAIHAHDAGLAMSVSRAWDRDSSVNKRWDLASWPHKELVEYVCPSEKLSMLPHLVILEQLPRPAPYDLPQTPNVVPHIIDPDSIAVEISEPTAPNANTPKEARQIMKIRRKKMKRHLLKKYRKRMAFTLRKIKRQRKKKKEAVFQARLAKIKESGDLFSARDWVQDNLDKARKGGFYINVLEKRQ